MAEQFSSSFDRDPSGDGAPDPEEHGTDAAQSAEEYAQGNRPAAGAQLSTPGSVFDQEWKGQPGATDFLGLDQEMAQEDVSFEAYEPEAPAMAAQPEVFDSEPAALPEELPLEPQTSSESMQSSSWFMDGVDDTAVVEDGQRDNYASSTEEHGAAHDLGLDDADESWFEETPKSNGLRRGLIAAAVLGLLALLAVGGTYGYKAFRSKDPGSGETLVAKPSAPASAVEPRADPRPPGELIAPGGGSGRAIAGRNGTSTPLQQAQPGSERAQPSRPVELVAQTDPQSPSGGSDPVESGEPIESFSDPVAGGSTPALDPVASSDESADPFGPQPQGSDPAGPSTLQVARPTSPQAAGVDHRSTLIRPEELILDGLELGGVRVASNDDLSAIWPNETVPGELIRGNRKVLTPAVGRVRVILETDEIFEGSLYALGQGTVWVESIHGRMGLDNDRIERIDRIATAAGAPVLGDTGSEGMTGLDRVCIRAEGGTFFGKVISNSEDKTIVITDGGARLTLHNSEVDLIAGKNPKVVVKN
jgi:hypothetical protein